jgi:FkbM family methyltransferase
MLIFNILKFIYHHPFNADYRAGAILRFLKWQLNCRINPFPIIYPYTENSRLIIQKGLTGATGNLYCGLMEYEDMAFLLHFLRPGDWFVDIGANIGSYTILASAEIMANTIAIEPISSTFKHLIDNISVNQIGGKVKALNIGLGSETGKLRFTKAHDTVNHVATENEPDTLEVAVSTLDTLLAAEVCPVLLKIDVEGFETEVLKGADNTLADPTLKAIIIELNGSGKRYGYDELAIHQKLLGFGFTPVQYHPRAKQLKQIATPGTHNTIYVRDKEFVEARVKAARPIKVGNSQQPV